MPQAETPAKSPSPTSLPPSSPPTAPPTSKAYARPRASTPASSPATTLGPCPKRLPRRGRRHPKGLPGRQTRPGPRVPSPRLHASLPRHHRRPRRMPRAHTSLPGRGRNPPYRRSPVLGGRGCGEGQGGYTGACALTSMMWSSAKQDLSEGVCQLISDWCRVSGASASVADISSTIGLVLYSANASATAMRACGGFFIVCSHILTDVHPISSYLEHPHGVIAGFPWRV